MISGTPQSSLPGWGATVCSTTGTVRLRSRVSQWLFSAFLRRRVTELLRQGSDECLYVMVTLIQKRGTCFRPGLSLVSVHISQTLEGDRGIPVHTGHRPQLTSCLGEASRCVPASEPIVEIAACCHDM